MSKAGKILASLGEARQPSIATKIKALPKTDGCAIYSYALVTGQTPEKVWPILEPYFNRTNTVTGLKGKGVNGMILCGLLRKAGYEVAVKDDYSSTNGKKITWGDVKKSLTKDSGTYIVMTIGHVIGVSNGKYIDTGAAPDSEAVTVTMSITK